MLIAALLVGALTAYYFGLRAGAYAAVAALGLFVVALFMPRFAVFFYVGVAAAGVAVWQIGSRRPRPPDAVLAVRWARRGIGRAWSTVRALRKDDDKRN
ncbi:MAG TPA: hypothetical protein VFF06_09055 [Polyangia bacterium]|nr:hypothetical protein [Polyangia bacterium]